MSDIGKLAVDGFESLFVERVVVAAQRKEFLVSREVERSKTVAITEQKLQKK